MFYAAGCVSAVASSSGTRIQHSMPRKCLHLCVVCTPSESPPTLTHVLFQVSKLTPAAIDAPPAKGSYDSCIAVHNALDGFLDAMRDEWLLTDEIMDCEWSDIESVADFFCCGLL